MKKTVYFLLSIVFMFSVFFAATTVAFAEEQSYSAEDWKPHNYVLSEGFGINAKKVNISSYLDYANDELKVYGNMSKGGIGVTFLPEIDLNGFSFEMSMDNWQLNSTDKWFGITFMDKGEKTDIYNEVPFYSKHSESWSNDMGAGMLVAWRPFNQTGENAQPGVIHIQFNNIGIAHSFIDPQTGEYNEDAGSYADGVLGWSGYLSTIQLCDTDWQPLTDYSNVKLSIREITENERKGYAVDFNDGYYIRTEDSIVWPTEESDLDLYNDIDKNQNGILDEWEKNLFSHGPAYSYTYEEETYQSMVPYANWGDPLYSLYNFNQIVKENGGKLYFNALYKDAFNMPEGEQVQFTIKKINDKSPTMSETTSLFEEKTVSANGFTATIADNNFYAGVYPYMVDGINFKEADSKSYEDVSGKIDSKRSELSLNTAKAVNFYGQVAGSDVAITEYLEVTYDLQGKENFKLYKVSGTDLDEVTVSEQDKKAVFEIKTFDANNKVNTYVMFYNAESASSGCGCGGSINAKTTVIAFVLLAAICFVIKKRIN